MEETTKVFLDYGLLGAIVIILGLVIRHLYNKVNTLQVDLVNAKDKEIERKDKDNEQYVNMLEKTLTALTIIEKSVFENNATLSIKVLESIEKANAPLISEIRKVLENKKNG